MSPEDRQIAVSGFLALALLAGILAMSFAPAEFMGSMRLRLAAAGVDGGHVMAYALLTASALSLVCARSVRIRKVAAVAVVVSAAGLLIELMQPMVGRTTNVLDLAANTSGVLLGVAAFLVLNTFRQARSTARKRRAAERQGTVA